MNCCMSPYRLDYITIQLFGFSPFPLSIAYSVLPYRIVVELSPVRGLVADCPIYIIFKHSRFSLFHLYVVVYIALRIFQQFNRFLNLYHYRLRLTFNLVLDNQHDKAKTILLLYLPHQ